MEPSALLLTGLPGVGKTTVLARVAEALRGRPVRGFVTGEIRERGRRVGFRLREIGGGEATLAHVDFPSPRRVGRYGVDVAALERIVASSLAPDDAVDAYLVDEIGKMECLSARFVAAVTALLDQGRPLVATIALRGVGPIARIRARPDVALWQVTPLNRNELPARVLSWLAERARGK